MSGDIGARLAELEVSAAQLERDIAAARKQLRDDLLAGHPTGEVRAFLSGLAAELAAIRREQAEITAVEEAAAAFAIDEAATAMASAVARDLAARLAALRPPPHPAAVRH